MTSLTVTLPPVPVKAIGGNSRGNRYVRNQVFQQVKMESGVLIRQAMNDAGLYGDVRWPAVTLHATWLYANAAHRPDLDNLASRLKAGIDSAVDVGLLIDDGPDYITELTLAYERAPKAGIRLTFTLLP